MDWKDYMQRAIESINRGQYEKAIADNTKAIELKEDDADVFYSRGLVYEKLGQYEKVIADYTKAIELKEDYDLPWFALAFLAFEAQSLQVSVSISFGDSIRYFNRGVHCLRRNNKLFPALYISRTIKLMQHFNCRYNLWQFLSQFILKSDQDVDNAFLESILPEFEQLRLWVLLISDMKQKENRYYSAALALWLEAPWRAVEIFQDYEDTGAFKIPAIAYRYWAGLDMFFDKDSLLQEAIEEHLQKIPNHKILSSTDRYYAAFLYFEDTEYEQALELLIETETSLHILYMRAWISSHLNDQQHAITLLEEALTAECDAVVVGDSGFLTTPTQWQPHDFDEKSTAAIFISWMRIHELQECHLWAWKNRHLVAKKWKHLEEISRQTINNSNCEVWDNYLLTGKLSIAGIQNKKLLFEKSDRSKRLQLLKELEKFVWWQNNNEMLKSEISFAGEIYEISKDEKNTHVPVSASIFLRVMEEVLSRDAAVKLLEYAILEEIYNRRKRGYVISETREATSVFTQVAITQALLPMGFDIIGAGVATLGIRYISRRLQEWILSNSIDVFPTYEIFLKRREEFEEIIENQKGTN